MINQTLAGAPASSEVRARDIQIIALVGLAHGISHFFQLVIPSLFPWLMPAFQLSFTEVGLLTTTCFAVSAIGQAPGGFVVDALGPFRVLVAALGFFVLAATLIILSNSFVQLFIAAVMVGLGNSVFHPADFTLLNRQVTAPRLGFAFSVHGLSGNIGWAMAPALLAAVAVNSHWRWAAGVAAVIAFLVLLVFWFYRYSLSVIPVSNDSNGDCEAVRPKKSLSEKNQFGFLHSSAVWMSFVFFLVVSIAFGGIQSFAPSAFVSLHAVSVDFAAWLLTVFLLGGGLGMILGGFLVPQAVGTDKIIALVLIAAAMCLVIIAIISVPSIFYFFLMFAAGIATGIAGPARDMLVRQSAISQFGEQALGRVYGLVYSGLDVGIAVSPLIFGVLLDRQRSGGVFIMVAVFFVLGGIVALVIGRKQQKISGA